MEWKLEIHQIDVGQGDSALIIVKSSTGMKWNTKTTVLLDCGPHKNGHMVNKIIKTKNGNFNFGELQHVVLSHDHEDHIGGYAVLKAAYLSTAIKHCNSSIDKRIVEMYKNLTDKDLEEGIYLDLPEDVTLVKNNDYIFNYSQDSGPTMQCIASPNDEKNENLNSLCFIIKQDKFVFYTGGDMNGEKETGIVKAGIVNNNNKIFFKVGHHGCTTAAQDEFLDYLKPVVAIISTGQSNDAARYNHPTQECIDRLYDCKSIQNVFLTSCAPPRNHIETNFEEEQKGKMIVSGGQNYIFKNDKLINSPPLGGDISLIVKNDTCRIWYIENAKKDQNYVYHMYNL